MARSASQYPTELELEILKVIWRDGPVSVRHVRDSLSSIRDLAYTSVMTVMNIMTRKGYLERRKEGGSFVYSALVTEKTTSQGMLRDLVDRVFDGSAVSAMLNLLETGDIKSGELESLKKLINQRRQEE